MGTTIPPLRVTDKGKDVDSLNCFLYRKARVKRLGLAGPRERVNSERNTEGALVATPERVTCYAFKAVTAELAVKEYGEIS